MIRSKQFLNLFKRPIIVKTNHPRILSCRSLSSTSTPSTSTPSTSTSAATSATPLYISGHGWTGAFGKGIDFMVAPETSELSTEDERENSLTNISQFQENDGEQIVNVAAGWGHTVIITNKEIPTMEGKDTTNTNTTASNSNSNSKSEVKIYVAGRPYDFQSLLRLNRLPSFIRRSTVSLSLQMEKEQDWGMTGKIVDKIFNRDGNSPQYQKGVYANFEEIKLPHGDVPSLNHLEHNVLAASAGLTAIIGQSGTAYTFGLNKCGQCGVGNQDDIHIWDPTPIDLNRNYDDYTRYYNKVDGEDGEPMEITDVALGLQHGLVLDKDGVVHAFGKGSRGQLGFENATEVVSANGQDDNNDKHQQSEQSNIDFEYSPIKVGRFALNHESNSFIPLSQNDSVVTRISAGWNHSAAVTKNNHVWIWGKNVLMDMDVVTNDSSGINSVKAYDSLYPTHIKGLPQHLSVVDISCGSHHTAILMEDGSVYATGIATDTNEPTGGDVVLQIIPPGLLDHPVRQFKSHFDRTTIVAGEKGEQVLEVQLWSSKELRDEAVFEPAWVEEILDNCSGVEMIHRGWLHTVVVGSIK